jgi:hypothetical protein
VETSVDVRVLAATNKIPDEAVSRGELRSDLYYRLNVFNIHMPPLREHKEDIPSLVQLLLAEMSGKHGRKVSAAAVGVGKPESPTPSGEFYVRDRLSGFGDPFYGPVAFGTSARSAILTDWPAGGFVGIHGTNEPGLIPGRISHGCIRMRNADIVRLSRLMPVGTPLTIR